MLFKKKQSITSGSIEHSKIQQAGRDIKENTFNIILPDDSLKFDFVITHNTNAELIVSSSFQGRDDEFKTLRDYITNDKKAILLSGMGGIGKTEICKKLYQQFVDEYKAGKPLTIDHIGFFKYEENIDSTIVNSILTSQMEDYEKNVKIAWYQLKMLADNSRLLLIFDDVNKQIYQDTSLKKLYSLSCNIIITSRNESFGEFIKLRIEQMSYSQCEALFMATFEGSLLNEQSNLEYVINELAGRHTLTIKLFASIANDHMWTISQLKEKLEVYYFNLSYLKDGQEKKMIEEYKKLFELSNLNDKEINILTAFSILPFRMLPIQICIDWMSKDIISNSAELTINNVCKKGWLEKKDEQFSMHSVVSEVIRAIRIPKLEDHLNLVKACTNSINVDEMTMHTQKIPYWVFAESVIKFLSKENSIEIFNLIEKYGTVLYLQAKYLKAQDMFKKALLVCTDLSSTEDLNYAEVYNDIGLTFFAQGSYAKALEWLQKALKIREKIGTEHSDTGSIYNNIALIYKYQGNYIKALEWYNKALIIAEKAGLDSPDAAVTYQNIAEVYRELGDYRRALRRCERALTINERIYGSEHPITAISYNNIGGIYDNQKDYDTALMWCKKALAINEKVLGTAHPTTAIIYNNLGRNCNNQGDYSTAMEWCLKALKINEKVLGTEHPNTASTYSNMAISCDGQGQYNAALEWCQKALAVNEKIFGEEHPYTAITYDTLAKIYNDLGDYNTALEWCRKALAINEKIFGINHKNTFDMYYHIANIYFSQGAYRTALAWYDKPYYNQMSFGSAKCTIFEIAKIQPSMISKQTDIYSLFSKHK